MARSATTHKASRTRGTPRPPALTPALTVLVDPKDRRPLQRQLYDGIRGAILAGRLPPGTRLPGERALAEQLEVSRTTVALACAQLRAEGYLRGETRRGTYVADVAPDDHLRAARVRGGALPNRASPVATGAAAEGLSPRGRRIASLEVSSTPLSGSHGSLAARAFRIGTPALDHFPFALWGRLLARRWRRLTAPQLAYAGPHGHEPLREAIAAYVAQARAVSCTAAQVLVVSGAQQAFDLCARVLLAEGDRVAVEEPGYRGLRGALLAAGASLVPIPVDGDGMDVAALTRLTPAPRLACVTPSHQFPLGVVLGAARRLALLGWAARHGSWIVEDDFDSEYRFQGRPLPSLQGMDGAERVIYVGTFSKTLFPALRLGYVVAPPALVEPLARARAVVDRHPATLEQAVLADFITEGHLARHVRRMRALYAERQETLLQLIARSGLPLGAGPVDAGMHLVAHLPDGVDDAAVSTAALAGGVVASPLSALYVRRAARTALLLGFAAFDRTDMADALRRLGEVLASAPIDKRRGAGQVVEVSPSPAPRS